MGAIQGSHISGRRVVGPVSWEQRSPADTAAVVSRQSFANEDLVADAVGSAQEAQQLWSLVPAPDRARVLHAAAELMLSRTAELAREITVQVGKRASDARTEIARSVDTLRVAAEHGRQGRAQVVESDEPGTVLHTTRRPLGVVGLITPWNFPVAIPLRKAAYALAAGNSVVLKPSILAAEPALHLADLLEEAGLPAGCFNVLPGEAQVGRSLVGSKEIAGVSFTGSTEVGREVGLECARRGVAYQGEMGGSSPLLVLPDAQVERAAEIAAWGAFGNAGQTCTATRRVIVVEGIFEQFMEAFRHRADTMRVGAGDDDATEIPPLVSRERRDEVLDQVDEVLDRGARLVCGAVVPKELESGAFLVPTILMAEEEELREGELEIFGPVAFVRRARDLEHALRLANETPYGLSAGIVTDSATASRAFLTTVRSGMLHVNRPTTGSDAHVSFGGMKGSGVGEREQSFSGANFFSHEQTVFTHTDRAGL